MSKTAVDLPTSVLEKAMYLIISFAIEEVF